jgi:LysR family glycine cleavage system transcriptional activator
MFGEVVTPVVSPLLLAQVRAGGAPPLAVPADLAGHALLDEDSQLPTARLVGWRRWLGEHQLPQLTPRRWILLNYTHQQVQAALAGHGVALARIALVHDLLARGELVEPFGAAGRLPTPTAYYMLPTLGARLRPELRDAMAWIRAQAALTRAALGEAVEADGLGEHD